MQTKSFGLDVGATTIKLISISQAGSGFVLDAALITPTPAKGMLSESEADQELIAKTIRKIVDEAKVKAPYVNVALPENQVYTKIIEMPVLSDKELSSAIYWEAEQYIPIPLTQITLDHKVLFRPEKGQGEKMDVLLVGAPTSLIGKYQHIFDMAGLSINAMETDILSAVRTLAWRTGAPNTLLVHMGAMNTSLAIIKGSEIVSSYSIPTGGIAFTRAIAADFGFTLSQAEEYKRTYGISEKNAGGKIGEATAPLLSSITSEIKKVLAYFNEKYKGEASVQQIVLSGGSAKLPGVNLYFAENCGIETVIANPWQVLSQQNLPKEIMDNAPDYTIALGLAMRDYEQ